MQRQFFFGPTTLGPGEGSKGQISFNFNYKVNFKDFYTKLCVCVLTNERYKIYQMRFSFCHLDHASGVGLGALGCPRGQKIIGGTMGGWGQKDFFQKFNQIWCVSYLHE